MRTSQRAGVLLIALAILVIILLVPIIPISYTVKEPYERVETYYETIPITTHTEWNVTWYTLSGDRHWGVELSTTKFPGRFGYSWGYDEVVKGYRDQVGFIAKAIIKIQKQSLVTFNLGADDGCELYLNGSAVLFTGTYSPLPYLNATTQITLSPGKYILTLYYQETGGNACVSFSTNPDVFGWEESGLKTEPRQRTVIDYKDMVKTVRISILNYLLGQYPR